MIKGGYYIKARKIQESDIAFAPPHVREIWDWLLKEANHSDNEKMNRGQTYRTYKDIQDGLKWFIGYRKMTYSKSQCETAMKWLTKHEMITTTKTTRGLLITVCNYDFYQDPKNYENHKETDTRTTTKPQPPDAINKNDKKKEEEKNVNISFDTFWNLYDKKTGDKSKLQKKWNGLKDSEREEIIKTLPAYVQSTPDKKFRKNPQTYLNNRSWEDEIIESNLYPGYKDTSNWDVKKNDQSDFSDYE